MKFAVVNRLHQDDDRQRTASGGASALALSLSPRRLRIKGCIHETTSITTINEIIDLKEFLIYVRRSNSVRPAQARSRSSPTPAIAMSVLSSVRSVRSAPRRLWPLAVVIGVISVMGFYALTDSNHLANDPALNGADYVGYTVCHRITERSFTVAGRQLPLCARCTGIYLGVSLVFAILFLSGRHRWSGTPRLKLMLALLGLIGVMGVDGINSYLHFFPSAPHLYEPRNWLRLITGTGAGLAMGLILFPALAQTLWRHQRIQPIIAGWRELLAIGAVAALAVVLVLSDQPFLLYVLGLVSALGVLIVLTSVNTTLLLIGLRRDATADAWRQTLTPLAVGLALALVQVALVSYLRFHLTGTLTGLPGLPV